MGTNAVIGSLAGCDSPSAREGGGNLPSRIDELAGNLQQLKDNTQGQIESVLVEEDKVLGGLDNEKGWRDLFLYESGVQGSLLRLVQDSIITAAKFLNRSNIHIGNPIGEDPVFKRIHEEVPLLDFFIRNIAIPPFEEAVFRYLPSALFVNNSPGYRWDIGLPASVLFALSHNLKTDDRGGLRPSVALNYIPIPQFVGGLLFWKIFRERGFQHSTVAHSACNFTGFIIEKMVGSLRRG